MTRREATIQKLTDTVSGALLDYMTSERKGSEASVWLRMRISQMRVEITKILDNYAPPPEEPPPSTSTAGPATSGKAATGQQQRKS